MSEHPRRLPAADRTILVIEDHEQLGESCCRFITAWGSRATRLSGPDDELLREGLSHRPDTVVVVSRDDVVALRYALLVEHLRPGVRLVVTIFDQSTAREIAKAVPNCTVLSMTDAIVPSLLAGCVHPHFASVLRIDGQLVAVSPEARAVVLKNLPKPSGGRRRWRSWPRLWLRSLDVSSRALVLSFLGVALVFGVDAVLGRFALAEPWPHALWNSARMLTTVGSSAAAEHGPPWYHLWSTLSMLGVLALVGLFTASLVDRVTGRRLTAILGPRAIPRRDHVIVVGLGQVGLRLCNELRSLGVPVVAVERNRDAYCLPLARNARIPVVLGRGGDRFLLRRLNVTEARALAAVSSDGLENVAVAVASRSIVPPERIVLRAGGDAVTAESRSLFKLAAVRDSTLVVGATVACHALELEPLGVFPTNAHIYAVFGINEIIDLGVCADSYALSCMPAHLRSVSGRSDARAGGFGHHADLWPDAGEQR